MLGYTSKYNTWEPAGNILDTRLIETFEELEKAKPPKTVRQPRTPKVEETPDTKQTKPTGRKPPMNRESIVPTPTRRSRRSTRSSDDTAKDESNGTDAIVESLDAHAETVNDDQIKNDNQKRVDDKVEQQTDEHKSTESSEQIKLATPDKSSSNSQDHKTTIEKVVSLSDKLLTPEKAASLDEKGEHQTNGQNGKLSVDLQIEKNLFVNEKLDVCLNGESVKRKSSETDLESIDEPSKKQLKTSDDNLMQESNGLPNNNGAPLVS